MSFSRYTNQQSLLEVHNPQYGELFDKKDLQLVSTSNLQLKDSRLLVDNLAEVHVYTFGGSYIGYDPDSRYVFVDGNTNSLLLDVRRVFNIANITKGTYKIVVNILTPLVGNPQDSPLMVREISPDRTEIKLAVNSNFGNLQQLSDYLYDYASNQLLNNVVANFGRNRLNKIVNYRVDLAQNIVYLKFYTPIQEDVQVKDYVAIAFEVIDPYIDTVILTSEVAKPITNQLKGPNFTIEDDLDGSNSTTFKTWNQLLDTNLPTTQRIIDTALSSSGTAILNIDYTDFNNFVFYSSAVERLKNFKYKLQLIQKYNSDNVILQNTTGSSALYIGNNIQLNNNRINELTSNFDSFERWLYYQPTSSLFTHDISGSLTPWPKKLYNGSWVNYPTTSSIATSWYSSSLSLATNYDVNNYNRLWWSIPEHILMDENNSQYVLFVEMVGHYFDILHSYVKALTQIHERDEHPQRGASNDLMYHIAKSFGWNLQNTRQLSDLWLYQLGTSNSGSYASTGSMFSLSHKDQTQQVWRRIVNNLPYLYKTKGTTRSVKAIMSMYGIPQTLISIKEYGGPSLAKNKPSLIEDRFHYLIDITGSRYIQLPRRPIPANSGSWTGIARVPDTIEFRFATNYSASLSQSLWAIEDGANRTKLNAELQLVHALALTGTASYSGSRAYGKLKFYVSQSSYTPVYTPYLPLYDNDSWTVRIYTNTPIFNSQSINIQVSRASDSLYGRIPFSASVVYTPTQNIATTWNATPSSPDYIILGGSTSSAADKFVGRLQGYKEYYTTYSNDTFYEHVLNPASYSVDNPTGSFYTLYRYFPLGVDSQRWGHGVYQAVSSSHPNRKITLDTTASFFNFSTSQTQNYVSEVETYYIQIPSLGGNVLRSDKVRIEDSVLKHELSPTSYSQASEFDSSPLDRNRLAIVFAPNDHVNLDIFNHMGFAELDQLIADPSLEFEREYASLDRFGDQYWRKYTQINNANNLIRILGLYDYTFFDQIKQLVPAKADLITGVLIEPDVLHRPKVQLTKRPTIQPLQWEREIGLKIPIEGENPTYNTSLTASGKFTIGYDYIKSVVSASMQVSASYFYKRGYITASTSPNGQYLLHEGTFTHKIVVNGQDLHQCGIGTPKCGCGTIDPPLTGYCSVINMVVIKFSGSKGETGSFIDKTPIPPINTPYQRVNYFYEPAGSFNSKYNREIMRFVSQSYKKYSSRSYTPVSYQIPEDDSRNNSRFIGSKLTGAGINIDSANTVDGGPVVTIIESNPNNLFISNNLSEGNLKVE